MANRFPVSWKEQMVIAFLAMLLIVKLVLHLAYDNKPLPMRLAVCHVPAYAQAVTVAQSPSPYLHQKPVEMACMPCHDDTATQGVLLGK